MSSYQEIREQLLQIADTVLAKRRMIFFKTGKGDYAEGDKFLGIVVPALRNFAKTHALVSLETITSLIRSPFNEERLLGLFILEKQYKKGNQPKKNELFDLYIANLDHVNNWNLVDSSAHLILGAHLYQKDLSYLKTLAQSEILWHRRIAIIATLFFIRKNHFQPTILLAEMLLHDKHDLIHKAVGWTLREVGERELDTLKSFLNQHCTIMPRTSLRYAIEKLPTDERQQYLMTR